MRPSAENGHNQPCKFCDEPCSALDPISSGIVEDRIASLRGRYTVVVVTHNLAQARRISVSRAVT